MTRRRKLGVLTLSFVLAAAAGCTFSAEDLGTLPGGTFSEARDVNRHLDVVGFSETADGDTHATLWQDGAVFDLGTLGGANSWAYGINSQGVIVGASQTTDGDVHGFLLISGTMIDLHALAPVEIGQGVARAINDDNWVTGNADMAAVVWKNSVVYERLQEPFEGPLSGRDINENGEIGGYDQSSERAFRWDSGFTFFGPDHPDELPATQRGYGIDDFSRVVGRVMVLTSDGVRQRAALFRDGVANQILTKYPESVAWDINSLKWVVGEATQSGEPFPMLWLPTIDWAQALPTLGGTSGVAYRTNFGYIVGVSERSDGRSHATLWR